MAGTITGACTRFVGDVVQALGVPGSGSNCYDPNQTHKPQNACQPDDDVTIQALKAVFDMETNGKIRKEKARSVVEKLGLIYGGTDQEGKEKSSFDLPGCGDDEVAVEEVIGGLRDETDRHKLLREAFKIFDENKNGYIEAEELKRVLQCLGLDKGWDMKEIEKMLNSADLNRDGKVDFGEFELMMG